MDTNFNFYMLIYFIFYTPSLPENQKSQETLSFPFPTHPLSHNRQRPPLLLTVEAVATMTKKTIAMTRRCGR
jgi:hypothetical protein